MRDRGLVKFALPVNVSVPSRELGRVVGDDVDALVSVSTAFAKNCACDTPGNGARMCATIGSVFANWLVSAMRSRMRMK